MLRAAVIYSPGKFFCGINKDGTCLGRAVTATGRLFKSSVPNSGVFGLCVNGISAENTKVGISVFNGYENVIEVEIKGFFRKSSL